MTKLNAAVAAEKAATHDAWKLFLKALNLNARLGDWATTTTNTGLLLSTRVSGPDAMAAVLQFAACGDVGSALQLPHLDYRIPGRVATVWQCHGVWLELWTHDTNDPVPARPAPVQRFRRLLRGPSGRLPYTRRRKETSTP